MVPWVRTAIGQWMASLTPIPATMTTESLLLSAENVPFRSNVQLKEKSDPSQQNMNDRGITISMINNDSE